METLLKTSAKFVGTRARRIKSDVCKILANEKAELWLIGLYRHEFQNQFVAQYVATLWFMLDVLNVTVFRDCIIDGSVASYFIGEHHTVNFVESQARLLNAYNKPGIKPLILFPLQLHRSLSLRNANETIPGAHLSVRSF